ncbi:hypothetical protein QG516_03405 [Pedobacter gandavensis]|uniref:hypothetical protein n=1 Tax=Pedobacter gandavensis TaxID=2679963 RepID=UPI002479C5AA|nr:hypothetical protein [Pedobacter gandavensis]WGQ10701.1 hypothetical protein QG516_03405 [Pedobacter gandavensis]
MENEQNTDPREDNNPPKGQSENEKANYTSLPTDGPVSKSGTEGDSDLQNNEGQEEETDDISGDLSGNAAANTDAEDQ